MWFGGWIALSVAPVRSGALPRVLAIGLPLLWVAAIPGSTIGLGALGAAYCVVLARTLTGAMRPSPAFVVPAR